MYDIKPAEHEVNEVYMIIKGDPSVGINDEMFTFTGHWLLESDPANVEEVRKRFAYLVGFIYGETPQVVFDFERKAELDAEAEHLAGQLAEEQKLAAQQFDFMKYLDKGRLMGLQFQYIVRRLDDRRGRTAHYAGQS